jgi:hypothetical protein
LFTSEQASRRFEASLPKGDSSVPDTPTQHALGDRAAFQLANVTKTPPQYGAITPRWLVRFLDWKPLEARTLRVIRVADDKTVDVVCGQKDEKALPETYVNYEEFFFDSDAAGSGSRYIPERAASIRRDAAGWGAG